MRGRAFSTPHPDERSEEGSLKILRHSVPQDALKNKKFKKVTLAVNGKEDQLHHLAVTLAGSIVTVFEKRHIRFTGKPILEKKPIVEFMHRMRLFGMEKFNNPTFIAVINYYLNIKEMKKRAVWGVLAVYIEQDYIEKMIRDLKYPDVDSEDIEDMKDACGAVCN